MLMLSEIMFVALGFIMGFCLKGLFETGEPEINVFAISLEDLENKEDNDGEE